MKRKLVTKQEAFHIFRQFEEEKLNISQICKVRKLSPSTFHRIKNKWWKDYIQEAGPLLKAPKTSEADAPSISLAQAQARVAHLENELMKQKQEYSKLEVEAAVISFRKELKLFRAENGGSLGALMAMTASLAPLWSKFRTEALKDG